MNWETNQGENKIKLIKPQQPHSSFHQNIADMMTGMDQNISDWECFFNYSLVLKILHISHQRAVEFSNIISYVPNPIQLTNCREFEMELQTNAFQIKNSLDVNFFNNLLLKLDVKELFNRISFELSWICDELMFGWMWENERNKEFFVYLVFKRIGNYPLKRILAMDWWQIDRRRTFLQFHFVFSGWPDFDIENILNFIVTQNKNAFVWPLY